MLLYMIEKSRVKSVSITSLTAKREPVTSLTYFKNVIFDIDLRYIHTIIYIKCQN